MTGPSGPTRDGEGPRRYRPTRAAGRVRANVRCDHMSDDGLINEPSVVVVGSIRVRSALGALFASWEWPVLALEPDDLSGIAAMRQCRADLLVIDGSGHGRFGDLELARDWLAPSAIVRLVDRPQDLTADPTSALGGVPARRLRERLLIAVCDSTSPPVAL